MSTTSSTSSDARDDRCIFSRDEVARQPSDRRALFGLDMESSRSSRWPSTEDCDSHNSSTRATRWPARMGRRSWSGARSVREELFRVSAIAARRLHVATPQ